MNRIEFGSNLLTAAALVVIGLATISVEVNAQGTKRKRTPTASAKTVPAMPQAEPQIISRAEDFPDSETQPALTNQNPKTDNSVSGQDYSSKTIEDLKSRVRSLESVKKVDQDEKQKRLLLNLDILTRSEQRSESLRKQLFEMIEKESTVRTKLDQIEADVRPESIERSVSFAGTLRPEELRNMRKKNLEIERTNLQLLLTEIQRTKTSLEQNVQRADLMVEKLRAKMEKEIDAALVDDPEKP